MIAFSKRVFRKLRSLPIEVWRAYRLWDYSRKVKSDVPIMTFEFTGSLIIRLYPEGVVPERLYMGLEDMTDYALVSQFLKPGMQVIDVGANIGVYSILADKRVGMNGRVWAFEPSSESYQRLLKNLALNSVTTVVPVKMALADRHGLELTLRRDADARDGDRYLEEMTSTEFTARGDGESVPVTTLDHYFEQIEIQNRFDFIKIDVEGAEYALLRGGRCLLEANPHVVLMLESPAHHCARMGYSPDDIYRFLKELGFGIYAWQSKRQIWVTDEESLRTSVDIWASREKERLPVLGS